MRVDNQVLWNMRQSLARGIRVDYFMTNRYKWESTELTSHFFEPWCLERGDPDHVCVGGDK